MTGETDNPSLDGTDNVVETSNYDNPESWDYYDPDEDNVETPEIEGTDDEAAETEAEDEAVEAAETDVEEEAEPEDAEGEQTPVTATEDAVVKLADGTTATVKDLLAGNMRQSDYTRKAQELATSRKELEANATRIESITQVLADHLASIIPPEPDPSMALSDPNRFTAAKAQYDAAMAQMQRLVEIGSQPKEIKDGMSEDDRRKLVAEENTRLITMFPEAGTESGRQKFFTEAQKAATELGFSPEELSGVTDHRMFALAHWAQRGMAAEKARATAKAKVEKAPPVTPRKPGQGAKRANRNAEAMRKLARSGSIRDAMAVDWD